MKYYEDLCDNFINIVIVVAIATLWHPIVRGYNMERFDM